MSFDRWTRNFGSQMQQHGLGGALNYTGRWAVDRILKRKRLPLVSAKRDLDKAFGMVLNPPMSLVDKDLDPTNWINWIVPPFSIGSGGHTTIFRMAAALARHGFRSRLYFVGDTGQTDPDVLLKIINDHFLPLVAEVHLQAQNFRPAQFVMATSWNTAYWAAACPGAQKRLYFVQDYEPYFYAHGSEYYFAEHTYRLGLTAITAGDWLSETLKRDFGMRAFPFRFSYDKALYQPHPRQDKKRRIFFYARHVTLRRGFELGILALHLLHQKMPDVEFILAGWDASEFHIPFPHLNAGVIAIDKMPFILSQCDAALMISLTNNSLMPIEAMACACPVVSNEGPNVEWQLIDGENALLCAPTPQALATGLGRVLTDEALRQRLIDQGAAFAAQTSWDHEGDRVAGFLKLLNSEFQ